MIEFSVCIFLFARFRSVSLLRSLYSFFLVILTLVYIDIYVVHCILNIKIRFSYRRGTNCDLKKNSATFKSFILECAFAVEFILNGMQME